VAASPVAAPAKPRKVQVTAGGGQAEAIEAGSHEAA
jgi:hypothetical protein